MIATATSARIAGMCDAVFVHVPCVGCTGAEEVLGACVRLMRLTKSLDFEVGHAVFLITGSYLQVNHNQSSESLRKLINAEDIDTAAESQAFLPFSSSVHRRVHCPDKPQRLLQSTIVELLLVGNGNDQCNTPSSNVTMSSIQDAQNFSLATLPTELIAVIPLHLSRADLARCSRVNTFFRDICVKRLYTEVVEHTITWTEEGILLPASSPQSLPCEARSVPPGV